jgi:hypothetical protein
MPTDSMRPNESNRIVTDDPDTNEQIKSIIFEQNDEPTASNVSNQETSLIPISTINNSNIKVRRKNYRQTCCICDVTSTNNPTAKFTSVPYKQPNIPTEKKNCEKTRRAFKKNLFYRNLFINRLGKKINTKRKNLRICDRHKMEIIIQQFTWLDNKGNLINDFAYFKLPVEEEPVESISDNIPTMTTMMNDDDEESNNIPTMTIDDEEPNNNPTMTINNDKNDNIPTITINNQESNNIPTNTIDDDEGTIEILRTVTIDDEEEPASGNVLTILNDEETTIVEKSKKSEMSVSFLSRLYSKRK